MKNKATLFQGEGSPCAKGKEPRPAAKSFGGKEEARTCAEKSVEGKPYPRPRGGKKRGTIFAKRREKKKKKPTKEAKTSHVDLEKKRRLNAMRCRGGKKSLATFPLKRKKRGEGKNVGHAPIKKRGFWFENEREEASIGRSRERKKPAAKGENFPISLKQTQKRFHGNQSSDGNKAKKKVSKSFGSCRSGRNRD